MDSFLSNRIHSLPMDLLFRVSYFLVIPKYGYMEELVHQIRLEWVTLRATWRQNHQEPDSKRIITRILVHRDMAHWAGEPVFLLPQ
jgi:membrane associated rhomboid family serine protease